MCLRMVFPTPEGPLVPHELMAFGGQEGILQYLLRSLRLKKPRAREASSRSSGLVPAFLALALALLLAEKSHEGCGEWNPLL